MSDIKKTALVILIIALLSNTFTQYAYAADYNHSELLNYEGYGQAMYESIVEQSVYMAGHYTDNKEYVSQSIDEIIDYANFWKDEFTGIDETCSRFSSSGINDCLRSMLESGGGLALTVGDWIKNLFSDYEETSDEPLLPDLSFMEQYMEFGYSDTSGYIPNVTPKSGYKLTFTIDGKYYSNLDLVRYSLSYNNLNEVRVSANFLSGISKTYDFKNKDERTAYIDSLNHSSINSVSSFLLGVSQHGGTVGVEIVSGNSRTPIDLGDYTAPLTRPITKINNYYRENGTPSIPVPQLKPQLVCADGTKISMNINGSTFLAVDGTVMIVGEDGTAEVNGQLCNLNWQKPNVEYTPDGVTVTQPDGTTTDLETGETTTKPPGATDLEGCTGVLCGIGKLLDGVGSIVKAIGDLVAKLLDGILALFVPQDLNFISTEFERITDKLTEKIAITETLKEALTGLFGGGGSNPLADISINLPITNEPLQFGNVSFIEEGVPILRKVISAIVVLYTIVYVYRKITGRGGVMER